MTDITTINKLTAPYVDVTLWPPMDIVATANACGQKYFTLAFIVASGSSEASWGGYYPLKTTNPPWFLDKITALRALGGDVIISCGGQAGLELAQAVTDIPTLVKEYQSIIDIYKVKILDFDIEGSAVADQNSIDRRNKALVILKKNNPSLRIHYTLPVMPYGLDANGNNVIVNAKANGLQIDVLSIMCMDY